jgi:hypothetical protein
MRASIRGNEEHRRWNLKFKMVVASSVNLKGLERDEVMLAVNESLVQGKEQNQGRAYSYLKATSGSTFVARRAGM